MKTTQDFSSMMHKLNKFYPKFSYMGKYKGILINGYNGTYYNQIEDFVFTTENSSLLTMTNSNAYSYAYCTFSRDAEYNFGGSDAASYYNKKIKFIFLTETSLGLSNTTAASKYGGFGWSFADNSIIAGGYVGGAESRVIEKMPIATEVNSTLGILLTVENMYGTSLNYTDVGYGMGGESAGGVHTNVIKKYFNLLSTTSTITAVLTYTPCLAGGISHKTKGLIFGGYEGVTVNKMNTFTFATETCAAALGTLISSSYGMGMLSGPLYGYRLGGADGFVSTIYRFDYITEDDTLLTDTLANTKEYMGWGQY